MTATTLPNPAAILVLVSAYCFGTDGGIFPEDSETRIKVIAFLRDYCLLEHAKHDNDRSLEVTERGVQHIKALLRAPLPVQQWMGFDGLHAAN